MQNSGGYGKMGGAFHKTMDAVIYTSRFEIIILSVCMSDTVRKPLLYQHTTSRAIDQSHTVAAKVITNVFCHSLKGRRGPGVAGQMSSWRATVDSPVIHRHPARILRP